MDEDLTIPALKAMRRILRAADLGNRALAARTGLTPSQFLVLQEIAERGEPTPSALAAALQFGQATITNIVDRLEQAGLVTRVRSERDKRRIHLRATAAGMTAIDQAPTMPQAQFSASFAALPEWEQAMILAGLRRLGDILGVAIKDSAPLLDSGAIDRPRSAPPEG